MFSEQCASLQDYSRDGMTKSQEELLQNLRMFGLVYQRKVQLLLRVLVGVLYWVLIVGMPCVW